MKTDRRALPAVAGSATAVGLLLAAFILAAGGMLWADFDQGERTAVLAALATRWGLPLMAGLALAAAAAAAMQSLLHAGQRMGHQLAVEHGVD